VESAVFAHRQLNRKIRPLAHFTPDADLAAMRFNDATRHRQPQPRASLFGRIVCLKNLLSNVWRYARSRIDYIDHGLLTGPRAARTNPAGARHRLDRMDQEVEDRLLDETRISQNAQRPSMRLHPKLDAIELSLRRKKIRQLFQQHIQINFFLP